MPSHITKIMVRTLVAVIVLIPSGLTARTINVPDEQPSIKAGIIASEDGDTVLVATGTYTGSGNRDMDFGGRKIVVRSVKGGSTAVIDCGGTSWAPHRAFRVHLGEDSTTKISGFLIINGYAPPVGLDSVSIGGAILCENNSSPTIEDCYFYYNAAKDYGGALGCLTGAAPRISDCVFSTNVARRNNWPKIAAYGGAIYCRSSALFLRNCTIASNQAHGGGGIFADSSFLEITYCKFSDNVADTITSGSLIYPGSGAGLSLVQGSTANLAYCGFDKNIAAVGLAGNELTPAGGGIAAHTSSVTLQNCTFYGNVAEKSSDTLPGRGAGIYSFESLVQIANCLFVSHLQAEVIGCNISSPEDSVYVPELGCCDIAGNELGDWVGPIADQEGQNGNFSRDPVFCNIRIANYHLWIYSPCAPDSNACGQLIGAYDIGCMTDVDDPYETRPVDIILKQNHPNPFNQATAIEYSTDRYARVVVTVYNLLGQRIRRLVDAEQFPGLHSIIWDGKDNFGCDVATGIYFYSLRAGTNQQTRKMIVLK